MLDNIKYFLLWAGLTDKFITKQLWVVGDSEGFSGTDSISGADSEDAASSGRSPGSSMLTELFQWSQT